MKHKLIDEKQILDDGFRKKILEEIKDAENVERKGRALRAHDIFKDRTVKWVMEAIKAEGFRDLTVEQMRNRAANISICKKIIKKLATAYNGGVIRSVMDDEDSTTAINDFAKELNWNTQMKKTDRYRQLFRNTLLQIVPQISNEHSTERDEKGRLNQDTAKWDILVKPLAPYEYDVIPDNFIPTIPRVVILPTGFIERDQVEGDNTLQHSNSQGQRHHHGGSSKVASIDNPQRGDENEETTAGSSEDRGEDGQEYIWWSKDYHFTTNEAGKIIEEKSPEGNKNKLGMLPFVNHAWDQDQDFWADGGRGRYRHVSTNQ